ncbi:MAG: phage holin family protein [Burkholderiales bacterium]
MADGPAGAGGAQSGGLFGFLMRRLAGIVGLLHTRLELLTTEIAEEQARIVQLVVYGAAAAFCLGVGSVLAALFVVVAFWQSHRLLALGFLAALFLVGGLVTALICVNKAKRKSRLFAASLAELAKDRDQLNA